MLKTFTALKLTTPILVTLAAAVALILIGIVLLKSHRDNKRADIGAALLTGAVFMAAAGLNQMTVDASAFRSSIAVTSDLTGFDPDGRSLNGLTLAGKNLHAAQMRGADLTSANVSYSDLKEAILADANAEGANFFYAKLHEADLKGLNLKDANLMGAEIATSVGGLRNVVLHGATVHRETCWRISLKKKSQVPERTPDDQFLDIILGGGLNPVLPAGILGHVCTKEEGNPSYPYDAARRVYICASEPFLRETGADC